MTTVLGLQGKTRRRLRTTNGVERLNEEIRRRERVIDIFANRESAIRLIGVLLMEIDEAWTTGRRCLDMEAYWAWKEQQASSAQTAKVHTLQGQPGELWCGEHRR
ncbi:hypothetical protein Alches_28630 [Alicyclobacillus hesperidum subsp. aegles]|nr:hypothetical protein Alches_28630 [Alicyclobacillus hesperidum subsp. aegles]